MNNSQKQFVWTKAQLAEVKCQLLSVIEERRKSVENTPDISPEALKINKSLFKALTKSIINLFNKSVLQDVPALLWMQELSAILSAKKTDTEIQIARILEEERRKKESVKEPETEVKLETLPPYKEIPDSSPQDSETPDSSLPMDSELSDCYALPPRPEGRRRTKEEIEMEDFLEELRESLKKNVLNGVENLIETVMDYNEKVSKLWILRNKINKEMEV